jgi:hypothetical protein
MTDTQTPESQWAEMTFDQLNEAFKATKAQYENLGTQIDAQQALVDSLVGFPGFDEAYAELKGLNAHGRTYVDQMGEISAEMTRKAGR